MSKLTSLKKNPSKSKETDIRNCQHDLKNHKSSEIQILTHQENLGNQAVQNLLYSGVIQGKLKLGSPNDKYEQEAERVAEMVTETSTHLNIQKDPKKRGELMQRDEAVLPVKQSAGIPESVKAVVSSGRGSPVDKSNRDFMESRFGYDFSQVRIHTKGTAAESADAMNSLAYTVGHDIVFATGCYSPLTRKGKRLLAHELAHVIQQTSGEQTEAPLIQRKPDNEEETLETASLFERGGTADILKIRKKKRPCSRNATYRG